MALKCINWNVSRRTKIGLMVAFMVAVVIALTVIIYNYSGSSSSGATTPPLRIIVDTDIGPFPDDVGAMSMLHTYADRRQLELLGIMSNNVYPGVARIIHALNRYFGRPQIPIGVSSDPDAVAYTGRINWTDWMLNDFNDYPHSKDKTVAAEDAVQLYRKLLSNADDNSVTILSIGYLTNLRNLLRSPPDSYSPLSGRELIHAKVREMIVMAGRFPAGTETNIRNATSAAIETLNDWPTRITFAGFEIGRQIRCGQNLIDFDRNTCKHRFSRSPVCKIFEMMWQSRRHIDGCWDEVATLLLSLDQATFGKFFEKIPGKIRVHEDGSNTWIPGENSGNDTDLMPQAYIRLIASNETVTQLINSLLER